jgi:glutamyl-tRNA synthetase
MLASGHAYRCYCTEAEVQAMREKATAEGRKPMYDRRCRNLTEVKNAPFVVRFKTPLEGEVVIEDLIKGAVRVDVKEIDDFIILRTNNTPTYNFTVVVDDVDMKITHVIRAEEHLNNTPKQMLLIQALGLPVPRYGHLPLVLAPDKTKLSKRHGAVGVTEYRREGYLSEAMVNYLIRLGWSHGDQEIFSYTELVEKFDLDGIGSSGSVFDRAKLDWYNAHYIKQKAPADLVRMIHEIYNVDLSSLLDSPSGEKLFRALTERAVKLTDFVHGTTWLLKDQVEIDSHSRETVLKTTKPQAIAGLREALGALPDAEFKSERIGPLFKETATKLGLKMPDVAKPARLLLTGTLASPDIGLVVESLGKARVLERLARFSQ